MNLTSRIDSFPDASPRVRISRPRSASLGFRSQYEDSIQRLRPKSAEFSNLNPHHNFLYQQTSNSNESTMHGDSSLLSYFTNSSSKLLLHLLKEPDENVANSNGLFWENKNLVNYETDKEPFPEEIQTSSFLKSDYQNIITGDMFLKNNYIAEWKKENPESLPMDGKVTRDQEERSIRFPESEPSKPSFELRHTELYPYQSHLEGRKKFHNLRALNKTFFEKLHDCGGRSEKTLFLNDDKACTFNEIGLEEIPKIDISESENEDELLKIEYCDESLQNKKDLLLSQKEMNGKASNSEDGLKNQKTSENILKSQSSNSALQGVSVIDIAKSKNPEKCDLLDDSFNTVSSESLQINDQGLGNRSKFICFHGSDSTYDEIIQLLQTLEDESNENHTQEKILNLDGNTSLAEEISKSTTDNLKDVFAYLEDVEKGDTLHQKTEKKGCISPSLEKLLNKTSVELAHEVLSLEIQIEDQKKGLKLLKDTIAEMKEEKKMAECEHQKILHKASSDAEALVKRHQKFIKQKPTWTIPCQIDKESQLSHVQSSLKETLLNEKKNLSEMVSKLVHDLKSNEEKYKTNIKTMEEKHLIEVKKAKNVQAVADKIKREKWMEMKTQKIKEMTVKGLEPELSRMAAQQQQELTELRNLHRAEIEALELKAARRTSELMDQLRTELTKEKETAITDKVNSLRGSMEREFEEERNKFHQNCQELKQRIRKLEEKLSNQEAESHFSLIETKQEMEKEKQKLVRIHKENVDDIKRHHSIELNNLRETLETDKKVCLKNQEKQLRVKFSDREAELHEQYRRERDREIEIVIEKFEKEQAKIQAELEVAGENKLKRVRDKLEAEIKELEANATDLKTKLSLAKSEASEREEYITQLNSQIRQVQAEICFLRKSSEKMISERTQLKEMIRSEFESSINDLSIENKNLQKEILDLKEAHLKELAKKDQLNLKAKNEMQKEITNVYSRIKAAISKKDKIIEALREENKAANERYQQLELVLDRQRRNLLLQ